MEFDELNNLQSEKKFLDINQFFGEMELTKDQKEKRIDLAIDFKNVVLFLFTLLITMAKNEYFDYNLALSEFRVEFRNKISKHVQIDDELERYISDITTSIVSTSFVHLDMFEKDTESLDSEEKTTDSNFFNSEKRAIMIAENESESVMNYDDFNAAIEQGYTKKKWVTMKDSRVRKTHKEVDNEVIPIKDYFIVGNSLLRFPHDNEALNPEEIIGCRCTIKYMK